MAMKNPLPRELALILIRYLDEQKYFGAARKLERESRFFFNLKHFEALVLAGKWDKAEKYLSAFTKADDNRYSMKLFFEIKRQKYLEALDRKERSKALGILLDELNDFTTKNEDLLKEITYLITLKDFSENDKLAKYGDMKSARVGLVDDFRKLIHVNPVLKNKLEFPNVANRLRMLINQSLNWQHEGCRNPISPPEIKTLFYDHDCSQSNGVWVPQSAPQQMNTILEPLGYYPLQRHEQFHPPAAPYPNSLASWITDATYAAPPMAYPAESTYSAPPMAFLVESTYGAPPMANPAESAYAAHPMAHPAESAYAAYPMAHLAESAYAAFPMDHPAESTYAAPQMDHPEVRTHAARQLANPEVPTNATPPKAHQAVSTNAAAPKAHPAESTNTAPPEAHRAASTNATPMPLPAVRTNASCQMAHPAVSTNAVPPKAHLAESTNAAPPMACPAVRTNAASQMAHLAVSTNAAPPKVRPAIRTNAARQMAHPAVSTNAAPPKAHLAASPMDQVFCTAHGIPTMYVVSVTSSLLERLFFRSLKEYCCIL